MFSAAYGIPKAMDSSLTTYYATESTDTDGDWLQLDFGTNATVSGATIRTSNKAVYISSFQDIQVPITNMCIMH